MIHVLISGALGSMGHQLAQAIEADPDFTVVSGVDIRSDDTLPYPVYQGFGGVKEDPDVLIDFSRADALEAVLEFATEKNSYRHLHHRPYARAKGRHCQRSAQRADLLFV
ncbi:MAG: hypothetical protein ACLT0Y_00415 [Christensenellales bacterium]